jgi:Predicted oxidoreductases of the aldo/keto reductase family
MGKIDKKNIDRRNFLKLLGGGAAVSTAAFYGCKPGNKTPTGVASVLHVPTDKMTYRLNPKTGEKVSLLGYGCMRLPTKSSADGQKELIDQEEVNKSVDYALAHGVNYYDTSPMYVQGMSEHAIGIALSRHPRNKYFVATKMSNFDPKTKSKEASIEMYHNSFKELHVDYVDYYLLHALGADDDYKERYINNGILDFLLKEREAGRIRNLGWSFHGDQSFFDYMLSLDIKWDFVQIQLNYVDWKHPQGMGVSAEYLYGELVKRNIPVVVMEPLLGGRLSKLNDHLVAQLKQRQPEVSVASWAFRFAGSLPEVLTVLSGMTYMEHLQDNIITYSSFKPLTDDDKAMLEETAEMILKYPTVPCTGCNYCMPCPYGLDIPGIFAHYNRCLNEGNVPKSSQDENYSKARNIFLVGYDRSVPRLRQANHCVGCSKCVEHCPQSIKIPKEMERIDQFVEQLKQGTI